MTSSAPAITKIGNASTAFSKDAALGGEITVSHESFPISWSASSQPSTCNGAWYTPEQQNIKIIEQDMI